MKIFEQVSGVSKRGRATFCHTEEGEISGVQMCDRHTFALFQMCNRCTFARFEKRIRCAFDVPKSAKTDSFRAPKPLKNLQKQGVLSLKTHGFCTFISSKSGSFRIKNYRFLKLRTSEDRAILSPKGHLRTDFFCPLGDVPYIPKGIYMGINKVYPYWNTEEKNTGWDSRTVKNWMLSAGAVKPYPNSRRRIVSRSALLATLEGSQRLPEPPLVQQSSIFARCEARICSVFRTFRSIKTHPKPQIANQIANHAERPCLQNAN